MRIRITKIGMGVHENVLAIENQTAYHIVKLMRYKNTDVITDASEHEAIIVAQLLTSGHIRYSTEDDRYHINGCSYTERDSEHDAPMCYPTWIEGHPCHTFFGEPSIFPETHTERDQDDYQRFIFSAKGTAPVMTKEVKIQ